MVATVPTKPPWNVRAIWVARYRDLGKTRWMNEGSAVEVQHVSLSEVSRDFLDVWVAVEETLEVSVWEIVHHVMAWVHWMTLDLDSLLRRNEASGTHRMDVFGSTRFRREDDMVKI
jgi:hypothetical protein